MFPLVVRWLGLASLRSPLFRSISALLFVAVLSGSFAADVRADTPNEFSPWNDSQAEDLVIKLVTFGPGDDVPNYFGHNGLVVEDERLGLARLYNYGMFSFGPDMLPNYLKGRLTFWVGDAPVRETYAFYMEMNRSVRVQELNLAPDKRMWLAQALARNVLPENREYLYHHYLNNCSTRLRDLIDQAVGGQFEKQLSSPARLNHRAHTRRYASKDPIIDFVLLFWMNDQMERHILQWDELFLPEELEAAVARASYVDAQGKRIPLVDTAYSVYDADRPKVPHDPPLSWPYWLLLGMVSGGAIWATGFALRRSQRRLFRQLFASQHLLVGLLFGVPGLLGFLMWMLTEHTVTYRNENQLLANPLTFLLLPIGVGIAMGSQRALAAARQVSFVLASMSVALIVLKILPSFDQDTLLPMTLLIPINLGLALAHHTLRTKDSA